MAKREANHTGQKNPHQIELGSERNTSQTSPNEQIATAAGSQKKNDRVVAPLEVQREYENYTEQFQSLILATTNSDGKPNASYAPFVTDASGNFYVFLSGLAKHTGNLKNNHRASVLFIEDEKNAKQIFARRRLTFDCTAIFLERESQSFATGADLFATRFQTMFKALRGMMDFQMVKLSPADGRFVIGFGQAYEVPASAGAPLLHIGGKDHDNVSENQTSKNQTQTAGN